MNTSGDALVRKRDWRRLWHEGDAQIRDHEQRGLGDVPGLFEQHGREKVMALKGYVDLADLPEDDRITVIGNAVMEKGLQAAIPVDEEGPDGYEKADRYVKKLLERFPLIEFVQKSKGPVPKTVMFIVRKKAN